MSLFKSSNSKGFRYLMIKMTIFLVIRKKNKKIYKNVNDDVEIYIYIRIAKIFIIFCHFCHFKVIKQNRLYCGHYAMW